MKDVTVGELLDAINHLPVNTPVICEQVNRDGSTSYAVTEIEHEDGIVILHLANGITIQSNPDRSLT